jgi:hypothetical protein
MIRNAVIGFAIPGRPLVKVGRNLRLSSNSAISSSSDILSLPDHKRLQRQRNEIAKYNKALKDVRKSYRNEHKHSQKETLSENVITHSKASILQDGPSKSKLSSQEKLTDPMVVGTFTPRRQLKRQRLKDGRGEYFPIPLNPLSESPSSLRRNASADGNTTPSPDSDLRSMGKSSDDRNFEDHLKKIFIRDLTPDNPRLHHLLHLWHASKSFVTLSNLKEKVDQFMKISYGGFATGSTPAEAPSALDSKIVNIINSSCASSIEDRIHRIMEFGIADYANDGVKLDTVEWGLPDRSFGVETQKENVTLASGSFVVQVLMREAAIKDRLCGTLMGEPNVEMVLKLGCSVPENTSETANV